MARTAALVLALAAGASGFAKSPAKSVNVVVKAEAAEADVQVGDFDYSSIPGGAAGIGGEYNFDPLNFAGKYPGMVPWFREAELKHGRICMLASVGMVVPAFVRVPGEQFHSSSWPKL